MFADKQNLKLYLAQFILLLVFIFVQIHSTSVIKARRQVLPQPVPAGAIKRIALGEAAIAAKLMGIWLLTYDSQAAEFMPWEALDFDRLIGWLELIQDLDMLADDVCILASSVFIEVQDQRKALRMLDLVRHQFRKAPQTNWRWMAQATLLAKYRLQDLPLAREFAHELNELGSSIGIPAWARDMEIVILQDMGEYDAASRMINTMLDQGTITDAAELAFLRNTLWRLQSRENANGN